MTTLTIICCLALGVLGRNRGFIFMWSVLLSALIAIYVSVMLSPTLVGRISMLSDRNLLAASMLAIAAGLFSGILRLALRLFPTALDYRLTDWWEQGGAGLCAFVAGFLAINYLLFVASVTPLANSLQPPDLAGSNPIARASAPSIAAACRIVSTLSIQPDRNASRQVVDWLVNDGSTAE